MGYILYIAGARGTRTVCGADFLEYGGDTSCYVLTNGTYALVIDCGSGISNAKELLSSCTRVDVILTHFHYDHIFGLLDMDAFPRGVRPYLHGMFDKCNVGEGRRKLSEKPFWPIPIPYCAYVNVEWEEEYRFGEQDEIKVLLHEANHPDYASFIEVEMVGKQLLLMCDYEHGKPFPEELLKPYDVLIYDGMYSEEEYERCRGYGHSTKEEGVILANRMGAKQLIISHLNPNHNDEKLREIDAELKQMRPNSMLARAGYKIELE